MLVLVLRYAMSFIQICRSPWERRSLVPESDKVQEIQALSYSCCRALPKVIAGARSTVRKDFRRMFLSKAFQLRIRFNKAKAAALRSVFLSKPLSSFNLKRVELALNLMDRAQKTTRSSQARVSFTDLDLSICETPSWMPEGSSRQFDQLNTKTNLARRSVGPSSRKNFSSSSLMMAGGIALPAPLNSFRFRV